MAGYRRDSSSKIGRITPAQKRYTKSILIFTEGENTEPIYFDTLKLIVSSPMVFIKTYGHGENDPKKLVDEALLYQKNQKRLAKNRKLGYQKPSEFDEIWVVFDADTLTVDQLNSGIAYAAKNKVHIAFSNPCFEYWMLLHAETGYTTSSMCNQGSIDQKMKSCFGLVSYSKDEASTKALMQSVVSIPNVRRALCCVEKLKEHHNGAGSLFPFLPFTLVDALILSINESLPKFRKILE